MESGYGGSESSVGEEEEATASAASTSVTSAEEGQKEEEERVATPASGGDAEVVEEGNSKDTEDLEVREDKCTCLGVSKKAKKSPIFLA